MHALRSYDFQDNVCQKLWTSIQAAFSYRSKSRRHVLRHVVVHTVYMKMCVQRRPSCCLLHSVDGALTRSTVHIKTFARTSSRNTITTSIRQTTRRRMRPFL